MLPSPRHPGEHLTTGEYYNGWSRALKAAGVPHVGTHGIRHRSATDIANSGIPVKVGMALTAHKTVTMFMRYIHTEDDPVRKATEPAQHHHRGSTCRGGNGISKKTLSAAGEIPAALPAGYAGIHSGIVELLDTALMTASYWEIGPRIVEAEQQGKRRVGYGEQLIERLASDLTHRFGRGFSRQNLQQMRAFFLTWPIRQTVSGESSATAPQGQSKVVQTRPWRLDELAQAFTLPWSTYVRLLSVKDDHAHQFYEAEALRGGGACASSTGRSAASSTNARPCPRTRPRCWPKKPSSIRRIPSRPTMQSKTPMC